VLTLKDTVSALTDHQITPPDLPISSVVIDSRQAAEGSLFAALPGEQVNGHDYVQAAFDQGANFAFIDQEMPGSFQTIDLRKGHTIPDEISLSTPICLRVENSLSALQSLAAYWRKKHAVRTIGITGSVGKTTTKELTAELLSQKYSVLKNPGNLNNEIGLPLTLLKLKPEHEYAVLEMGFYIPGEIQDLCDIALPDVGVVTNIGTVHAERAGSKEMIAQGKAELVQSLPPSPEGIAILNMDDPWVRWMFDKTQAQIFSYGISEKADLTASEIKTHGLDGISCTINFQGEPHHIHSPLLGRFSVYTILRAVMVALVEGVDWKRIEVGLAAAQVDLRMRQIKLPNGVTILDDTYNASPASTNAALELLKQLNGRRVAILGDMLELGPYEEEGHQSVGSLSASAADVLVLVGQNSKITAEAAINNGFSKDQLLWFPNSQQAARPAADIIRKGDVVLIKGSNSMRMDRIKSAIEEMV